MTYTVHIKGPGLDSLTQLTDLEDIEIVSLIVKKIGNSLKKEGGDEPPTVESQSDQARDEIVPPAPHATMP